MVEETRAFMQRVYAWMTAGLIISGATAYYVATHLYLVELIVMSKFTFYALLITELVLVMSIAWLIPKINSATATALFILYCFTTGLTLSVIFLIYTIESIGMVFFITAGMFGGMSVYGAVTKTDLTSMGQIMIMGLWGIILASLANFYFQNPAVDYFLSWAGVVIFTSLTAYDTQKIIKTNIIGNAGTDEDKKEAIMGALVLYLDFINLFLKLLRLFGKRRK